jgi:hypothetical protein
MAVKAGANLAGLPIPRVTEQPVRSLQLIV